MPPGAISERMIELLSPLSKIQGETPPGWNLRGPASGQDPFIFDALGRLAATSDERGRRHPRGESLRSHDRHASNIERHRQYPLPTPFSQPEVSSCWEHSGA